MGRSLYWLLLALVLAVVLLLAIAMVYSLR
jgi:hypothetical protein